MTEWPWSRTAGEVVLTAAEIVVLGVFGYIVELDVSVYVVGSEVSVRVVEPAAGAGCG